MELETSKMVYTIPEDNMEWLTGEVEKLNKRARRLKLPEIVINVIGHEDRSTGKKETIYTEDVNGEATGWREVPVMRRWIHIEVVGQAPKLPGWRFIGKVDHSNEGGNIVRNVPGEFVPEVYRERASLCDHCGTKRRRNETFILQSEDGNQPYMQVGRQCLGDFLGHTDPEILAKAAELLGLLDYAASSAEDQDHSGGRGILYYQAATYLGYVAAVIRRDGWLSRTKARDLGYGGATADAAWMYMTTEPNKLKQMGLVPVYPGDKDFQLAADAVEWVKSDLCNKDGKSDYEHNLCVVFNTESGHVSPKNMGIAASLVPVYQRHVGQEIERKTKKYLNEWYGEEGQRLDVTLTVTYLKYTEGMYGPTTIVSFQDAEGRAFKWFASGEVTMEQGRTYQLKGSIKKHDEYNGKKSTVLTRCKVLGEVAQHKETKTGENLDAVVEVDVQY